MLYKWMKLTLVCAGVYNIIWGAWVVFFPMSAFELAGAQTPTYPQIWQCVGMIVAVYGLGYLIASSSPLKHWPIVLVGLVGKIFGPIGFIYSIYLGFFPLAFGWNIVFNDIIWWIPFGGIMLSVWRVHKPLGKMEIIPEEQFKIFTDRKRTNLINSLSGYKSANLIATCNEKGQSNISIVSSVFHLGASPALVGFIIRPDSARRDTLENIKATGQFTINHVNKATIKKSHQTSARYDKDISEFQACGLSEEVVENFKAPFVKESHVKMAVELIREEKLPENGAHLIIGTIKMVCLPKDLMNEDGSLDLHRAATVCVSGLDTYNEVTPVGRLSYAKPDTSPKWL